MALSTPEPETVRRWVTESCTAQDIEVKVRHGDAIGRVAALLREGRHPHRTDGTPPDQGDP